MAQAHDGKLIEMTKIEEVLLKHQDEHGIPYMLYGDKGYASRRVTASTLETLRKRVLVVAITGDVTPGVKRWYSKWCSPATHHGCRTTGPGRGRGGWVTNR